MTGEITIRWTTFHECGEQILKLRRQVFVDEQRFSEDLAHHPKDADGLHLVAWNSGRLVAAVSAYIFEDDPGLIARHGLPPTKGRIVYYGKRVALPEYRGTGLSNALVAMLMRAIYETVRPDYVFCALVGVHRKLAPHYAENFGFEVLHKDAPPDREPLVMIIPDEPRQRASYLKTRKASDEAASKLRLAIPSLVRFLDRTGRLDRVGIDKLRKDNLYTAPLSLRDELPRLSAQTRVLYREQKSRLGAVDFPPPPARLLDIGSGPGVYLSLLSRDSKFRGYELVGLDVSEEMVFYARLSRPDFRWIHATAYETGEPSQSYDVVHANFLLMHLLNPALALHEIRRILKPNGIFYTFEVDDSTFQGPAAILDLVDAHCDICMSNRKIMNALPSIASQHGFELVQRFSTNVKNTATRQDMVVEGNTMELSRVTMWGILSYMGQREELSGKFKAAQELYFNSAAEVSVHIPTHVYRKVDLGE